MFAERCRAIDFVARAQNTGPVPWPFRCASVLRSWPRTFLDPIVFPPISNHYQLMLLLPIHYVIARWHSVLSPNRPSSMSRSTYRSRRVRRLWPESGRTTLCWSVTDPLGPNVANFKCLCVVTVLWRKYGNVAGCRRSTYFCGNDGRKRCSTCLDNMGCPCYRWLRIINRVRRWLGAELDGSRFFHELCSCR